MSLWRKTVEEFVGGPIKSNSWCGAEEDAGQPLVRFDLCFLRDRVTWIVGPPDQASFRAGELIKDVGPAEDMFEETGVQFFRKAIEF